MTSALSHGYSVSRCLAAVALRSGGRRATLSAANAAATGNEAVVARRRGSWPAGAVQRPPLGPSAATFARVAPQRRYASSGGTDAEGVDEPFEWVTDVDTHPDTIDYYDALEDSVAPPSSEFLVVMDPEQQPDVAVPSHFDKSSVILKGYDHAVLDSYVEFILRAGKACALNMTGRVPLPTLTRKYTVLKGPHVHKQHREQFEARTHRRLVQIHHMSGETATVFLDYILRLVPPGVEVKLSHVTVEAPTDRLADELGMESTPNTAAELSKQLAALVDDAQMATLTAAFQAYRSDASVKNLCDSIPDTVLADAATMASIKGFVNSLDHKEFDVRVIQRG